MTLQRRKQLGRGGQPLRAKPRAKGNRAELEIIGALKLAGWTHARRNFQSGGQGGGDILEGPLDVHLEVKHRERCAIKDWIRQAWSEARPTDIPLVVFRRNHSAWYAALPWDDWVDLRFLDARSIYEYVVHRDSGRVQLWSWLAEAGIAVAARGESELPVVAFMCDDMRYAAVPFDEVLVLLRLREESQTKEMTA